jgi:lipopolysaccharide transport system ATP-binding protein
VSDIVIKTENVGKKYVIGHEKANGGYATFRDALIQTARGVGRKVGDLARGRPILHGDVQEEVWALQDVNFEIERGDRLGIIGRNGAGKSTLLKILSRIVEPSTGRVTIRGRVASLLEVGTGFHPELTGRENIFLNGAILGMTRAEIRRKFDEIVAFAEIDRFLDTPVKRYSSGMYVRLAFAVAAHLEPEVLVVDEVLAVGDLRFQKKCLGKMQTVAEDGRTVLFVSHNMAAIQNLCSKTVVLTNGKLAGPMETSKAIRHYAGDVTVRRSRWTNGQESVASRPVIASAVVMQDGEESDVVKMSRPFDVFFELSPAAASRDSLVGIHIVDSNGMVIYRTLDIYSEQSMDGPRKGARSVRIPAYGLATGEYRLTYWLGYPGQGVWDHVADILTWSVQADCPKMMRYPEDIWKGVVGPGLAQWTFDPASSHSSRLSKDES